MSDHEFIEVLNRRWCIRCDLFQARPIASASWHPRTTACDNDTPFAEKYPLVGGGVIVEGQEEP